MIVPMKKLTLIVMEQHRDEALVSLRDMGAVHVSNVRIPEPGRDLDQARERLTHIRRALELLPKGMDVPPTGKPPEDVVERVWELLPEREALEERLRFLEAERVRMEPFGNFDPAELAYLKEQGVFIRLFQVGPKEVPTAPDRAYLQVLCQSKERTCFVVVTDDLSQFDDVPGVEIVPPEQRFSDLLVEIEQIREKLDHNRNGFMEHAGDRPAIRKLVDEALQRVIYHETREGMGLSDGLAWLQGWVPSEFGMMIENEAAKNGWGYVLEEPGPEDAPPVLIRNARWVKPIQAVFDMLGVMPSYDGVDTGPVFLLFLSLFAGMLVGDAGYGLLFVLAIFITKRFLPAKAVEKHADVFRLVSIMGYCTIGWGVLTGTYFGLANIPAPLKEASLHWLNNQEADNNLMFLCFLIGAIHLTLAHVWRLVRDFRSPCALAQVGWIMLTWVMFYAARNLVLFHPFPEVMYWFLTAGILLIVLFMTPLSRMKTDWFNHVMLPLTLINNFVDVVSYIRLFAVGAATFAVASAFNGMGAEMTQGLWSGLAAALIVFFGHTLNVLLAAMGVVVHGIRLNTLEFANHLGLEWSGMEYAPFRRIAHSTESASSGEANNSEE